MSRLHGFALITLSADLMARPVSRRIPVGLERLARATNESHLKVALRWSLDGSKCLIEGWWDVQPTGLQILNAVLDAYGDELVDHFGLTITAIRNYLINNVTLQFFDDLPEGLDDERYRTSLDTARAYLYAHITEWDPPLVSEA